MLSIMKKSPLEIESGQVMSLTYWVYVFGTTWALVNVNCKYVVRNVKYDLGVKYFRKELGEADFSITMVMVNTFCLIPYKSKWPLPSLPHFTGKCLTYLEFWVFWVPLWHPKIIMFKSMTFKLSNAVLHVPLWSLGEILHTSKDWRFLHNFQWKVLFL